MKKCRYNNGMEKLYSVLNEVYDKNPVPLKNLGKHIKELSDFFNKERYEEKDYMQNQWTRRAYLFYFYPINVFKYFSIIKYHNELFRDKQSFFDYGAGPLTLYTAMALAGLKPNLLFAVDKNPAILDEGKNILKQIKPDYIERLKLTRPDRKIDLLSFGNVFAEMTIDKAKELLKNLIDKFCKENSLILILEPGTKNAFRKLRLLEKYLGESGYKKLNLCPMEICPVGEKDWCHENIKFPRSLLIEQIENQTKLDNRFVNFCYLLMSKEASQPNLFDEHTYRMISNLIEHKGYYVAHFCGRDGIVQIELLKKEISDANHNFTLLKRGDIVKINSKLLKGTRYRIGKDTIVLVEKSFQLK